MRYSLSFAGARFGNWTGASKALDMPVVALTKDGYVIGYLHVNQADDIVAKLNQIDLDI